MAAKLSNDEELLLVMIKRSIVFQEDNSNQADRCDTSDEGDLNETEQSWKHLLRIDSTSTQQHLWDKCFQVITPTWPNGQTTDSWREQQWAAQNVNSCGVLAFIIYQCCWVYKMLFRSNSGNSESQRLQTVLKHSQSQPSFIGFYSTAWISAELQRNLLQPVAMIGHQTSQ